MTAGDTPSAFSGQVAEFYDGHTSGADELPTYFRRCATFQVRPDLKGKALNVLELGCGNGRLSVFLATEYGFNMTAVDVSTQAIQAAQDNARRHGARISFVHGDILSGDPSLGRYDLIIGHFILHEVVGTDFNRLARFLADHLAPEGYCTFLENSYFNAIYRWIREALPRERRVSHPYEYPFDPERYAILADHFRFVRRDCPAVNVAERFYRQFWPSRARTPWLYRWAAAFDGLLTWALPPAARRWVSYFQVVSFSQRPLEQL